MNLDNFLQILNKLMSNKSFVWLFSTGISFICLLIAIPMKVALCILAAWISLSAIIKIIDLDINN